MKAARSVARGLAAALALVLAAGPAAAWEAQTTLAGLAEQPAASSSLHQRLIDLGFAGGLYEELTVPPADAPELIAALDRYSPIQGFVPDQRGRQYAVAWLVAGAVLADSNPTWAADHFLDPATGKSASTEYCYCIEVDDGRIRHMTKVWNDTVACQQLGWM